MYRAVNKYPGYPRGIRRPVPERRENRRTSAVANAGAWFLIERRAEEFLAKWISAAGLFPCEGARDTVIHPSSVAVSREHQIQMRARLPGIAVNCALVWRQVSNLWGHINALAAGRDNAGYRGLGSSDFTPTCTAILSPVRPYERPRARPAAVNQPTRTSAPPSTGSATPVIQPEVMVSPLLWLVSDAAANVTGRRFLGIHWDPELPPEQAAEKAGAPVAWTSIATMPITPSRS